MNLTDVTIAGNSVYAYGGGLTNFGGGADLTDVTISDNYAGYKCNLYYTNGTVSLIDTIVAGQLGGGDHLGGGDLGGDGSFSGKNDLIGDGTGETGLVNGSNGNIVGTSASPIDPMLAPLGNYGGPTRTTALLPGSPAIAKGVPADDSGTTTLTSTDQRGIARPATKPDIGALQDQGFTVKVSGGSPQTPRSTSSSPRH